MQIVKAGFKSNKAATLLGLGLALLYVIPELMVENRDLQTSGYGARNNFFANAIPVPDQKPENLPFLSQPEQFDLASLRDDWTAVSFSLQDIRYGEPVPRYFVDQIPVDILDISDIDKRKQTFLSVILPLVLNANEKIKEQRERLVKIASRLEDGDIIAQSENRWLSGLAESYREDKSDLESLMLKVDTIPVSIAMAQAVEESGWGTSRFAREGNALFGQRVWSEGQGIVPSERGEGEVYEVRAFDTLADSVQAYTHNLNAHPAYEQFRAERARRSVEPENTLNGFKLADTLSVYSERGAEYVDALKNLIQTNRFDQFEKAELESERLAGNRY